jgi:hypothetical protein
MLRDSTQPTFQSSPCAHRSQPPSPAADKSPKSWRHRTDRLSAPHEVNAKGARVEQVRKFTVLKNDFTPLGDDPELTPTLKVKRNVVARKYKADTEAIYAD